MEIRWMAVVTGFVVDVLITWLIGVASGPAAESLVAAPDVTRPEHLALLALGVLSTGVGGYVAGRMAQSAPGMHGLLVATVGVLFAQLPALGGAAPMPRVFVIQGLFLCAAGALGGLLSAYVPRRR
jgi:putative membrane protein (TIGR04086 family)